LIAGALIGWPLPGIQDEFSYLLGADTFAHGRWTNPTHPMWIHFETFHTLQTPSYAPKYPPGQSFVLGLGQRFLGHPAFGVYLSCGLMVAAICWMLQAFMPPKWALTGALLVGLRLGLAHTWAQSYWGGAVAATGGALLLGGVRRMVKRQPLSSIPMAAGLVVLACSRPFEGLMLAMPCGILLLIWSLRIWREQRLLLLRTWLPATCVLAAGAATLLYYNYRVTGHPLKLPYAAYQEQYSPVGPFIFNKLKPIPKLRHEVFVSFIHKMEIPEYHLATWKLHLLNRPLSLFWRQASLFLGPFLLLTLSALPLLFAHRWSLFLMAVWLSLILGAGMEIYTNNYYYAPAAAAVMAIGLQCLRALRWALNRASRKMTAYALFMLACAISFEASDLAQSLYMKRHEAGSSFGERRARLERQLTTLPGDHLVLVAYPPDHDPNIEWVYNRADIDRSRIVWARDMGEEGNADLLSYFAGRRVWQLKDADDAPHVEEETGKPAMAPTDRAAGQE
jgi:hypothetical protein